MFTIVALLAATSVGTSTTGEEIIRAMHDRYAGQWYEDLTFVQRTTYYDAVTRGVDSVRIWYESLSLGGNLRIDVAPLDAGNGMIFRSDSLYGFRDNALAFAVPFQHPLLLLGFDVYSFAPEKSIRRLGAMGFDLSRVYETRWQGRDVYVVGAESADDRSNQFWIDKERLVYVRSIQYNPGNGSENEVQFNKYEELAGGWISPEVVFLSNGRITLVEEYGDYRADIPLAPEIFQVDERIRLPWVKN